MKKSEMETLLAWLEPRDRKAALKRLKDVDRPILTLYQIHALRRREEMRRAEDEQHRKDVHCMYGPQNDEDEEN